MGEEGPSESWMSSTVTKVLVALLLLWVIWKIVSYIRQIWFAIFLNYLSNTMDPKVLEVKGNFLSSISSTVSHDPQLRKENAIRLLEIGVGTGTNFSYYPDGTRLVVVDPNPHFRSYYDENRKKFPNIHSEDIIVTKAEDMDMVESNSIDVVVTTWVLCSVDKTGTEKILRQILRVLAPGGKYYFYEHVEEFDTVRHGTRRTIQHILTATRIWPFIFDGCCLNRDMLAAIQKTGFSKIEAQRSHNVLDHFMFQLVNPTLKGVAVK